MGRGAVECEIIRDFGALEELAADWERLFLLDPQLDVFQNPVWARLWWHSFGNAYELWTAVTREDGRVIGILPLVQSGRCLRFPSRARATAISAGADAPRPSFAPDREASFPTMTGRTSLRFTCILTSRSS